MTAGLASDGAAGVAVRTLVDDGEVAPIAPNYFRYTGHWEHVVARNDGRALGTSSRSFHAGDVALLTFTGTQVRVYGVLGEKGGYASLSLDGQRAGAAVDFYAPRLRTAALVYTSPMLPPGRHSLRLQTTGRADARGGGAFVNIDYATVSGSLYGNTP